MSVLDSVWAFIFAIGTAQGLFLAAILLRSASPNRRASSALAGLVLVFSLGMAEELIEVLGYNHSLPHALLSTSTLPFLVGPAMLFYGRSIMDGRTVVSRRELWHFLPFVAATAWLVPFYALPASRKPEVLAAGEMSTVVLSLAVAKTVHVLGYLASLAWKHSRQTEEGFTGPQKRRFRWYRRSTLTLLGIGLLSAVLYYNAEIRGLAMDTDYVTFAMLTVVIYAWAAAAILSPDSLFLDPWGEHGHRERGGSFSPEERARRARELERYMLEQEPHLDPDLKRQDLAADLEVTLHQLSEVLNLEIEATYNDYINRLRVGEFKARACQPENSRKTTLALALESGFRSKSTFNRAFRKFEGMTAKEYRKMHCR